MSPRNREKRRQLRTACCGRPLVIVVLGEEAGPTQTMKLWLSMKDFIKDTSLGGSPRFASLIKRIWWLTLSYPLQSLGMQQLGHYFLVEIHFCIYYQYESIC